MNSITALICFFAVTIAICNALPTTDLQSTKKDEISYNPFSSAFRWTSYNIAVFTAGIVVISLSAVAIIGLFFPIFGYKICYALGGCQNTLDNYVDQFIGVQGHTRKIAKRDLTSNEMRDMEYVMGFLRNAMKNYDNKAAVERDVSSQNNVMRLAPGSQDHQIEKRSPMDYIEPILIMVAKAYNEYVDPELKKNFKKPPSIR